jgi:1-acyl-sn-glycerol-3-phosphate acyltransferase
VFLFPFIAANINVQSLATGVIFGIMDVFFSEIGSRGTHYMPPEGEATIVAIAPHANQFIDPCVAMRALRRPMRFLVAAKSMRKGYIAAMAKPLGAIPVERPDDLKRKGEGTITVDGTTVTGSGTK